MGKKKRRYTPQQIHIIRKKMASAAAEGKSASNKKEFPNKFPFWARLKIGKNRTTLVIDETLIENKKTRAVEDGFVHREATHTNGKNLEEVSPNPDKDDARPMYLKRPRKLPKILFKPHNKDLAMPESLRNRYEKNNK